MREDFCLPAHEQITTRKTPKRISDLIGWIRFPSGQADILERLGKRRDCRSLQQTSPEGTKQKALAAGEKSDRVWYLTRADDILPSPEEASEDAFFRDFGVN